MKRSNTDDLDIKTVFKVSDKYFDDIEDAKSYSNQLKTKTQFQQDLDYITNFKENTKKVKEL